MRASKCARSSVAVVIVVVVVIIVIVAIVVVMLVVMAGEKVAVFVGSSVGICGVPMLMVELVEIAMATEPNE